MCESLDFLICLGEAWEAVTAQTAAQALELMALGPFAAVVSDLRLPDRSGPQFLDDVMNAHPGAQRFLLVDLADRQTILKCVGTSHHFLSKPCDAPKLLASLDRAAKLDTWFANDAIKKLMTQMHKLPSPPAVYFQIVRELQSPKASLDHVGALIAQDLAVTAKLLQLTNSASFGLQRKVANPSEAVLFLGLETTKSLILLAHTYSHFDRISAAGFSVEALWRHSLNTAQTARTLARAECASEDVEEETFTAGLLHDIGKLLLAANVPEKYGQVNALARTRPMTVWEAEQEVFGATHAELGAWLAALWGLPLTIVEALALHHHPSRFLSKQFCPLAAVHVANVLEHERRAETDGPALPQVDLGYLAELGLQERVEGWRLDAQALWQKAG